MRAALFVNLTRFASHERDCGSVGDSLDVLAATRLKHEDSVKAEEPAELYELIAKQYCRFGVKLVASKLGEFTALLYGHELIGVPAGTGVSFL